MARFTNLGDDEIYRVEKHLISQDEKGSTGAAIDQLAAFENFHDEILAMQTTITYEMEVLRNQGQTRSVKFRELFNKKQLNNYVLIMLKSSGVK